jgi:hypothetical protein
MFFKLQPSKLYKNVQEPFSQAGKKNSAEISKMTECHFWTNVMLRQPCVWAFSASRASPTQKLQWFIPKAFHGLHFFVFWGTHLMNRYLSYFTVKQIWRKSTARPRDT